MKAMLLAAGRGERMRPLTDKSPKPLLKVGGKSLIEYRLESLSKAGINECVINLSYRAEQIRESLADGKRWGLSIQYSYEGEQPLESAGGIIHALPLLGDKPFILVNSDIWTDYDFNRMPAQLPGLAHLVMVDNPEHNPAGDFSLHQGIVSESGPNKLTYSGIGIYHPLLFKNYSAGKRPLRPVLVQAMRQGEISGEHYHGQWQDIGTPERLFHLRDNASCIKSAK
ncbi:MAG: nucleotidyltransferase family protein [Gammaproteobacteria bacterium]|nr:nucleotidyltransferase family protein [Gammaproteobacteria bacterium]